MPPRGLATPLAVALLAFGLGLGGCGELDLGRAAPAQSSPPRETRPVARPAAPASQCGARFEPVVVVVLESPQAVRARRAREAAAVVSEDASTVVFADGRVLTARLEEVGTHLGRLGWAEREIVISSRFASRGGAARFRPG